MPGQILVLDDDRLVLATVTHGLQQAGYTVYDADNGDDAILLAHQHRPELALLDIRMEGKTGFDVAAYLRDGPRIPFMFLSAFSDEATRRQASELGAIDYLVKPVDVATLVPRVAQMLAQLRQGALAPPLPTAATAPEAAGAAAAAAATLPDAVLLALGVLMHRHGATRQQARQRLERLAAEQGLSLAAQAERIVAAVEELARS